MKTGIIKLLEITLIENVDKWIELYEQNKIDIKAVYPGLEQQAPTGYEYLTSILDGYLCWKRLD